MASFILGLAKFSILLLVLALAIPLVLILWLLGMVGRWKAGRQGRSNPAPGGTVDLAQCPTCGDWVEGRCRRPGCAASGEAG